MTASAPDTDPSDFLLSVLSAGKPIIRRFDDIYPKRPNEAALAAGFMFLMFCELGHIPPDECFAKIRKVWTQFIAEEGPLQ